MTMDFLRALNARLKLTLGICAAVVMLGIGFTFGWLLGINTAEKTIEKALDSKEQANIIDVGNVGEETILPSTAVEWIYCFSECGHELKVNVKKSYVGYTKDMLETEIFGAHVISLTSEAAVIRVDVDAYCPEHYMLVMVEQHELAVFRTSPETLKNEVVMELDFNTDALTKESIRELESGMIFRSLAEIDAYLENAET